jgi:foldase protein PrsA
VPRIVLYLSSTLAVIPFALASTSGCGGSTSANAVAVVGGNVITKASFEHWLHVAAVRDYQQQPLTTVPAGVVPDPPLYTHCVAHLKAEADKPSALLPAQSAIPPKKQCEQRYQRLREQVLGSLITAYWLIGEGKARGLVATDKAVNQYVEMSWKNAYPSRAAFEKSLVNAGETMSDQLFRAKVKVFSAQIEKQYASNSSGHAHTPALLKFLSELPRRWTAKTSCRKGYVVPNCKQYKGMLRAEPQLL